MSVNQINQLIRATTKLFKTIKEEKRTGCRDLWCGKCKDVYERAFLDSISEIDHNTIVDMLKSISLPDLATFGREKKILKIIDTAGFFSVFQREIANLDLTDVQQIDIFLHEVKSVQHADGFVGESELYKKHHQEFSAVYANTLQVGIKLAVKSGDSSLTETVILALGEKANDHPELIKKP